MIRPKSFSVTSPGRVLGRVRVTVNHPSSKWHDRNSPTDTGHHEQAIAHYATPIRTATGHRPLLARLSLRPYACCLSTHPTDRFRSQRSIYGTCSQHPNTTSATISENNGGERDVCDLTVRVKGDSSCCLSKYASPSSSQFRRAHLPTGGNADVHPSITHRLVRQRRFFAGFWNWRIETRLWGNCYGHQLLVWDPLTGRSQSFSLCPTDHNFSPGRHAQWKKESSWGLVSKQVQRIKCIRVCNASV